MFGSAGISLGPGLPSSAGAASGSAAGSPRGTVAPGSAPAFGGSGTGSSVSAGSPSLHDVRSSTVTPRKAIESFLGKWQPLSLPSRDRVSRCFYAKTANSHYPAVSADEAAGLMRSVTERLRTRCATATQKIGAVSRDSVAVFVEERRSGLDHVRPVLCRGDLRRGLVCHC